MALILLSLWEKALGLVQEDFFLHRWEMDEPAPQHSHVWDPLWPRGWVRAMTGNRAAGEMAGHFLAAGSSAQDKSGPWNSKWTCLPGWNSQGSTPTQMCWPWKAFQRNCWYPGSSQCRIQGKALRRLSHPDSKTKETPREEASHLWPVTLPLMFSFSPSPLSLCSITFLVVLLSLWHLLSSTGN